MNLKKLAVVIGFLAVLAGLILFLDRDRQAAPLDERAGERIVADQQLRELSRLEIRKEGEILITLERGDHGHWFLAGKLPQPVEFSRLSRLADTLAEASINRFVTERPERLERLNLGQKGMALYTGEAEKPFLDIILGDSGNKGGTYFRFAGNGKAYLLSERLRLDTAVDNWTDKTPFALDPEAIASVELAFVPGAGTAVGLERENAEADFSIQAENDDREVEQERVTRFLRSLLNLRSTRIVPRDGEAAASARDHRRSVRLRTFKNEEIHLFIGRKPEIPAPEAETPGDRDGEKTEAEADPDPVEEAGPVLVWLEKLPSQHPFSGLARTHAFVVGDSLFTNLPAENEILQPKEPTKVQAVQP